MPLLPLLFKRIATSESYRRSITVLRYFRRTEDSNISEEKRTGTEDSDTPCKVRVAVPKPTMTGLGTFIRGGNRSRLQPSVRDESFMQLDSFHDDYHEQLKAGRV